jgi:outer membrane lipoprotein SlyB
MRLVLIEETSMADSQRRIHPLMAGAAVAVIVFSAVGVGMMTGILPSTSSKEAPPAAPVAMPEAPAAKPASSTASAVAPAKKEAAPVKHTPSVPKAPPAEPQQLAKAPEPPPVPKPAPCMDCGVVEAVDVIQQEGQGTGLGAVAGGVAGGLLGAQFGKGTGKTVATVAGVAGGALAGHEVEKHVKSSKQWNVRVRMEDGSTRTITQETEPGFRSGDPVKVVEGKILAR